MYIKCTWGESLFGIIEHDQDNQKQFHVTQYDRKWEGNRKDGCKKI